MYCTVMGADRLRWLTEQPAFSAKAVLNEHGVLFFPPSGQHKDQKATGISYEEEYQGNALAATISPGRLDIRFHQQFTEERVMRIVSRLASESQLQFLRGWDVTYQGKAIGRFD